jgi:hypothetical protein
MSLNDQLKNIHKSFQSFKGGNVKPVASPSVLSEAIQSVTESAQESIPEASAPVTSAPVDVTPKTKSSTIIWIVVIALVVLVIFGIILYVQYKNKKKNEALIRPGPGSNRQAAFQPNTGNPRPTSTQQEDTSDLVPI